MNSSLQIDILMATYQSEAFLKPQIDSILNQTYSNWHLLISDGGSTDRTLDIVEEYQKKYPSKIMLLPSIGRLNCSENFERLMQESQAELIMFCDHDDIWLPEKIEKALECAKLCDPDKPFLVYSDLFILDSKTNGKLLKTVYQKNHFSLPDHISIPTAFFYPIFYGCTFLFNKKLKNSASPFFRKFPYHDVFIAMINCCFSGQFIFCPTPYIMHRTYNGLSLLKYMRYSKWRRQFSVLMNIKQESNNFYKSLLSFQEMVELLNKSPSIEYKDFISQMASSINKNRFARFWDLAVLWFGEIPFRYYFPRLFFLCMFASHKLKG